eukprot:3937623-Rhodomonas_salina.1
MLLFSLVSTCGEDELAAVNPTLLEDGGLPWTIRSVDMLDRMFFKRQSPQGVTHLPIDGGLVFSGRTILKRTAATAPFYSRSLHEHAVPLQFSREGYDHIGDVSVAEYEGEELIFAPLEEHSKTRPLLAVLRVSDWSLFATCPLHQSHASLAAVNPADMVVHSTEFRDVSQIKRYAFPSCTELPPLPLRRRGAAVTLQGVQGAAVYNGTLFLSTNQIAANGGDIFAVSLRTGEVEYSLDLFLGAGRAEMEGVDVVYVGNELRMLVLMKYCMRPFVAVRLVSRCGKGVYIGAGLPLSHAHADSALHSLARRHAGLPRPGARRARAVRARVARGQRDAQRLQDERGLLGRGLRDPERLRGPAELRGRRHD